jgi:hypothetical protein
MQFPNKYPISDHRCFEILEAMLLNGTLHCHTDHSLLYILIFGSFKEVNASQSS